jgi:hypothetical protein
MFEPKKGSPKSNVVHIETFEIFMNSFKGQLISECLLGVIDFPKKQRKI